jgi:peroxiredoxin
LFDKTDCAYSATAIEAVKEMQDFNNKSFSDKAGVVIDALKNKHP